MHKATTLVLILAAAAAMLASSACNPGPFCPPFCDRNPPPASGPDANTAK